MSRRATVKSEAPERLEASPNRASHGRAMPPPTRDQRDSTTASNFQLFSRSAAPSIDTRGPYRNGEEVHSYATVTAPSLVSVPGPFNRSGAPSVETRLQYPMGDDNQSDGTQDVHLMQMKIKQNIHNGGRHDRDSPSSQAGDLGFTQDSFVHNSFTDIGIKLKACNDTLGELQQLGVQHVAQLPELVMVGDQSAGKSSLMSGLAELDLPRSGGVCTRCPIHIRLSRSNDPHWSCSVSLQQDYDYEEPQNGIQEKDVTKANPFPPWVPKSHRVVKNFKTIYIKSEIEDVLRWAQIAVLNHNKNSDLYIPGEGAIARDTSLVEAADQTDAQFSPNIVALEIKGPNLPDLSFYDLPGVFLAPPHEKDAYLVRVVRNLSDHYIRRPQAIIMWALPMNQDPENSISLGIIRNAKAQSRTIGVMTKADKVQPDNTATWVSILRGERHPVGQGFFITSRPPLDKGDPLERATQWEEQFFQSNAENWPAVFQEFHERCGVELLKDFLSKQLGDAFSSSLPSIKHKVHERLRQIQNELATLPELPHNVEHEVKKSLYSFYATVREAIIGTEFQAEWSKLNKLFQNCIIAMKPTCILRTPELANYRAGNGLQQPIPVPSSDDESPDTPTRKRPRASDSTIRPTPKRSRQEPTANPAVKQEPSPSTIRFTPAPAFEAAGNSPFAEFHTRGRQGLNVLTIRSEIMRQKRAGMPVGPGLIPSKVYDVLILGALQKWQEPLDCYIDLTMKLFSNVLLNALKESMAILSRRNIFFLSKQHLEAYIEQMGVRQRGKLADIFQAEAYHMFTTNDEAFRRHREQEEEMLKRGRSIFRLQAAGAPGFPAAYKILPYENMSEEDRAEERNNITRGMMKLREDEYSTEIGVAAVVRGYYILAAMRFVESVTLSVNSRLFRDVTDHSLDLYLDERLGLTRADDFTFNRLMEEDDGHAVQRDQLKREMAKLRRAMESIIDLESGGNTSAGFNGPPVDVVEVEDSMEV